MYWQERSGKYRYFEKYTDKRTGKAKTVSCTLEKNTKQAQKEARRILSEKIRAASEISADDITVAEAADRYLAYQSQTVKASTYHRNCGAIGTIKKMLGEDTRLSALNAGYINKCLLESGRKFSTLNEDITRLKAFLNWCYRNDYLESDAFLKKIKKFKIEKKSDKLKYLEGDELRQLLNGMRDGSGKMMIEFLALSGLRIGEAVALDKADIDIFNRKIHVYKTYDPLDGIITSAKTDSSHRDVYMQDELLELVLKIFNIYSDTDCLLPGTNSDRIQYRAIEKLFHENTERILGTAYHVHSLRHTHASLLFEQGMSLEAVSLRLGHANSQITKQIYLHVTDRTKDRYDEQIKDIRLVHIG